MLDSKKDDMRSVCRLAVEDSDPHELTAIDSSDVNNVEVDEVYPCSLNQTGIAEDNVIMGLRHFEENGPQLTPIARFQSDCFRLISFQISAVSEDRDPCIILDIGAEITLLGPG